MRHEKDPSNSSVWKRISHRFSSQSVQPQFPESPEPPEYPELPGYQIFPIPREPEQSIYSLQSSSDVASTNHLRQPSRDLQKAAVSQKFPAPGLAPPPPLSRAASETDRRLVNENSYIIEYENDTLWPCFKPNEGDSYWNCPEIVSDPGDALRKDWALGKAIGARFGSRLFPRRTAGRKPILPPSLFDLAGNQVVASQTIEGHETEYIAVSHVWGNEDHLTELPGSDYGVGWDIPIQSSQKLDQILTACRAVGGVRYMWMDVLCCDQRKKGSTSEMDRMGMYFREASGCIVWLDNTYYDPDWPQVLHSITEVNRIYNLDRSARSTVPVDISEGASGSQGSSVPVPQDALNCFRMLRNLTRMERAPWFKRVWTLQEGIIPDRVFFVTPERYILDRSCVFKLMQAFGQTAQHIIDHGLRWGVALLQELQRSELWKMLKLKQLYEAYKISYQHVFHAVKTRRCRHKQDRLLGVLGLTRRPGPPVRPVADGRTEDLDRFHYVTSVESGNFSSLLFLGGTTLHTPESMGLVLSPESTPNCIPPTAPWKSHSLLFQVGGGEISNRLTLRDVGYDIVTAAHCLSAKGSLVSWLDTFPNYLELGQDQAVDIVRACGIPGNTAISPDGAFGPGYLAAVLPWNPGEERMIEGYEASFLERVRYLAVKTVVMALKCRWLEAHLKDSAVVVLWTRRSGPQLAVVTEQLDNFSGGRAVAIMPGTFLEKPGEGCLICVRDSSGSGLRKVGIGLGESLRSAATETFVLE